MRKLKIDLEDLAIALESASPEASHFLDLETGKVEMVAEETRGTLQDIYEEIGPEQEENPGAFEAGLRERNLPDWMQGSVREAARTETGFGKRYPAVPEADSREGYRDMEDFIMTVSDRHLQEKLEIAIEGKGAFRRFKDVIARYPDVRERWFAFSDERVKQRVLHWLEAEEIEPVFE